MQQSSAYPEGLDAEELAFQQLYGPWHLSSPQDAAHLLDGYPSEWWIAGGSAIEAFTGVRRPHEDIDVSLWRKDVGSRQHLKRDWHLWSNEGGRLRPLTDEHPEQPAAADQIRLHRHALAPWQYLVLNPDRDGRGSSAATRPSTSPSTRSPVSHPTVCATSPPTTDYARLERGGVTTLS